MTELDTNCRNGHTFATTMPTYRYVVKHMYRTRNLIKGILIIKCKQFASEHVFMLFCSHVNIQMSICSILDNYSAWQGAEVLGGIARVWRMQGVDASCKSMQELWLIPGCEQSYTKKPPKETYKKKKQPQNKAKTNKEKNATWNPLSTCV